MNFQSIPPVEGQKQLLDAAFGGAKTQVGRIKRNDTKRKDFQDLQRHKELLRIRTVRKVLVKRLGAVVENFPSFDNLTEFYRELTRCFLPIGEMKHSLGALSWAAGRVEALSTEYERKAFGCKDNTKFPALQKAFYGRISSTVKQVEKDFVFLDECRKVLKKFPRVKDDFTVCIAGFPNVGKSTLLARLSGTKPDIAEYAFTTRRLNVGYLAADERRIQLVDTPGTLNRFEKMNDIEKQAHLALKHLAAAVVYVFDLSEQYPLEDQERLLKDIQKLGKPVIIYVSKEDLLGDAVREFCAKRDALFSADSLRDTLLSLEREPRPTTGKEPGRDAPAD